MSDKDAAAPQTLEEKLAQPISVGGRARATLEQLHKRRGFCRPTDDRVEIISMDELEIWSPVSGVGKASTWERVL